MRNIIIIGLTATLVGSVSPAQAQHRMLFPYRAGPMIIAPPLMVQPPIVQQQVPHNEFGIPLATVNAAREQWNNISEGQRLCVAIRGSHVENMIQHGMPPSHPEVLKIFVKCKADSEKADAYLNASVQSSGDPDCIHSEILPYFREHISEFLGECGGDKDSVYSCAAHITFDAATATCKANREEQAAVQARAMQMEAERKEREAQEQAQQEAMRQAALAREQARLDAEATAKVAAEAAALKEFKEFEAAEKIPLKKDDFKLAVTNRGAIHFQFAGDDPVIVTGLDVNRGGACGLDGAKFPLRMRFGDEAAFTARCNILEVTIETNRGHVTQRFKSDLEN
jgi:hypothetical protein